MVRHEIYRARLARIRRPRECNQPAFSYGWFRQDRASREAARRCRKNQVTAHVTCAGRSIGAAASGIVAVALALGFWDAKK
jgi:hypothetical protein